MMNYRTETYIIVLGKKLEIQQYIFLWNKNLTARIVETNLCPATLALTYVGIKK